MRRSTMNQDCLRDLGLFGIKKELARESDFNGVFDMQKTRKDKTIVWRYPVQYSHSCIVGEAKHFFIFAILPVCSFDVVNFTFYVRTDMFTRFSC